MRSQIGDEVFANEGMEMDELLNKLKEFAPPVTLLLLHHVHVLCVPPSSAYFVLKRHNSAEMFVSLVITSCSHQRL